MKMFPVANGVVCFTELSARWLRAPLDKSVRSVTLPQYEICLVHPFLEGSACLRNDPTSWEEALVLDSCDRLRGISRLLRVNYREGA